jgi:glutamate-1-semialdehyde 2,1-aminomutase
LLLQVAFLPPTSPLSPDVSFVLSLLPPTLSVPLPSNLLGEVYYLSLGFAVLILPEVYRRLLTLCAIHVASIAPPYVSTVLGSFSHSDGDCLRADGAPDDVALQRGKAFAELIEKLARLFPKSSKIYDDIEGRFSDIRFFDVKKVFFPFREMAKKLSVCVVATRTDGPYLIDADGHKILDVSGSYGVNVIGYEGFKSIGNRAHKEVLNDLGPVLGPIHPDLRGALSMLSEVSGQPECSLHMSGTEAVMCATRLARFNTKKKVSGKGGGERVAHHITSSTFDSLYPSPPIPTSPQFSSS